MSVLQTMLYIRIIEIEWDLTFCSWDEVTLWTDIFTRTLFDELYIKIQFVNVNEILHNDS